MCANSPYGALITALVISTFRFLGDGNLDVFGQFLQLRGQTDKQLSLCVVGGELADQKTVFRIRMEALKLFSHILHADENAPDARDLVQK